MSSPAASTHDEFADGDLMAELADDAGSPSYDEPVDAAVPDDAGIPDSAAPRAATTAGARPAVAAEPPVEAPPEVVPPIKRTYPRKPVEVEDGWNVLLQFTPPVRSPAASPEPEPAPAPAPAPESAPARQPAPVQQVSATAVDRAASAEPATEVPTNAPPAVRSLSRARRIGGVPSTQPPAWGAAGKQARAATAAAPAAADRQVPGAPQPRPNPVRPSTAVRTSTAVRASGVQPRPTAPVTRRARPSRAAWAAVAAVLIAALVIAGVVYVVTRSDDKPAPVAKSTSSSAPSSTPTPTPTASATLAAGLGWLKANLHRDDRIGTDPATAAQLKRNGFTAVIALNGSTPRVAQLATRLDWLLWDPSKRGAQHLTPLFKASVPVARFGSGNHRLAVRSIVARRNITSLLAQDENNRQLAGTGLSANPNIKVGDAILSELRAGRLDLRAATFLAVLASTSMVEVVHAPENSAEKAAFRPIRELVIDARPAAVRSALSSLPAMYQPARVSKHQQQTTLIWDPAVNPMQPVS